MDLQIDNYVKITESRKKNRIIAIVTYCILSSIAAILPVFIKDKMVIIVSIVVIIGGLAILFSILLNPIKNPLKLPYSFNEDEIKFLEAPTDYYNEQLMTGILKIIIPMVIIYSVASVMILFSKGMSEAIYFFLALAFFAIIGLVFSKITIQISDDIIKIRLGLFKDVLKIGDVLSIRSTTIKSMGSYFGYGKRVGTDGSIGYIAGPKVGVRMEMKNGKTYVISVDDPQELVNVIRYVRSQYSDR